MMALDAPAPGVGAAWLSEHGEVVELRVSVKSDLALLLLQRPQDQLVVDNQCGLPVGLLGQAAAHYGVRQTPLLGVHVPQGQSVPVKRRVVPEEPLSIEVVVGRALPLLRR